MSLVLNDFNYSEIYFLFFSQFRRINNINNIKKGRRVIKEGRLLSVALTALHMPQSSRSV